MIISSQPERIPKYEVGHIRSFVPENYGLIFNKPVFDMTFIITHEPLMSKISNLQNYFQSKHKFTTHCIYLEDIKKLQCCLRDLKSQDILYAVVLNENCEVKNSYDLYVLHRDEVLTSITIEKVDALVAKDFNNLMNKVKILKSIPSKWPHPVNEDEEGLVYMNEQLRYYLCLLFDYRTLTMGELKYVNDYLITRKRLLEKAMNKNNFFESTNCIQPSKFVFKGPNSTSTVVQFQQSTSKLPIKYTIFDANSESLMPTHISKSVAHHSLQYKLELDSTQKKNIDKFRFNSYENDMDFHQKSLSKMDNKLEQTNKYELKRKFEIKNYSSSKRIICQAEVLCVKFISSPKRIEKIEMKTGRVSKLRLDYVKAKLSNSYSKKKDNSFKVKYIKSSYFRNKMKYVSPKSIDLKASSSSRIEHHSIESELKAKSCKSISTLSQKGLIVIVGNSGKDVTDLTNECNDNGSGYNINSKKRKVENAEFPIKTSKLSLICSNSKPEVINNPIFIPPKSSPDGLLNLFVMVLNLIPLELPNNNAIYKILSHSCIEIKEGILEPALKNVKVNYDNCKTNGVTEIITNIYSIYNEPEKEVKNTSFMIFIWNKYFPDHLSNFNLMILFYRFVKLLMLYTMFNKSLVTKKLVLDVIEKIDIIVNFDFKSSVSTFKRKQLSCFSKKFDKYFKEHDQLHILFLKLSNSKSLTADSKKLDATIKKKKIDFTIGPLLNYFITSVNSIHHQMEPVQIEIIYGAVRTLRFCLRKINLNSVQTSFTKPHLFNFNITRKENHFAEILKEIKLLCKELKYYQCVLFTEKHYDFINCLLDFSWMVEGTIDVNSDFYKSKPHIEPLITVDPIQFIQTFSSFECPIFLQYHPESELEYLKAYLKERWTNILHEAFTGSMPEPCGARIIKEINVLLPQSWGLITFDEAIIESSKLYYEGFQKLVETDPTGWYVKFSKTKSCATDWLTKYHLPINNLEILSDYQYMLESKYKYAS